MVVSFDRLLVTGKRTGTSAKTGKPWGRLEFFDGKDSYDLFFPSEYVNWLGAFAIGTTYENVKFELVPSYSGGVSLVPSV